MQVADRPGDISILTHIFVSDNRTVVNPFDVVGAEASWARKAATSDNNS